MIRMAITQDHTGLWNEKEMKVETIGNSFGAMEREEPCRVPMIKEGEDFICCKNEMN